MLQDHALPPSHVPACSAVTAQGPEAAAATDENAAPARLRAPDDGVGKPSMGQVAQAYVTILQQQLACLASEREALQRALTRVDARAAELRAAIAACSESAHTSAV